MTWQTIDTAPKDTGSEKKRTGITDLTRRGSLTRGDLRSRCRGGNRAAPIKFRDVKWGADVPKLTNKGLKHYESAKGRIDRGGAAWKPKPGAWARRQKARATVRESLRHEDLISEMVYDPETGLFDWRNSSGRRTNRDGRPGALRPDGYIYVSFRRVRYLAHRLAWFYVHGVWPHPVTDHINGNKSDNRIANLRQATHKENAQNVVGPRKGKGGRPRKNRLDTGIDT